MFFPLVAHAAEDVKILVQKISFFVLNPIISILFGIAFVVFMWGVVEYLMYRESDEARTKGKQHMIWGLVGMFIMFAAFALVRIIANTIGSDVPIEKFGS